MSHGRRLPADRRILAIVPAWNEQESLAATLADLASHPEVDVVVINDGSTDATAAELAGWAAAAGPRLRSRTTSP